MARNLRKGSKVKIWGGHGYINGIVIKKYSVRKKNPTIPAKNRTIVEIKASGQRWIKYPKEIKRIK